jgi:hypothetical protein
MCYPHQANMDFEAMKRKDARFIWIENGKIIVYDSELTDTVAETFKIDSMKEHLFPRS